MPHRTIRTRYETIGLQMEEFTRGNDAPCSVCGIPFGFGRAARLRDLGTGRVLRGYDRACYECAFERINGRVEKKEE